VRAVDRLTSKLCIAHLKPSYGKGLKRIVDLTSDSDDSAWDGHARHRKLGSSGRVGLKDREFEVISLRSMKPWRPSDSDVVRA